MPIRLSFATISVIVLSSCFTLAQQPTRSSASDREKAGLKGPVKTVMQESNLSLRDGEWKLTTTTKYSPEGRIVQERTKNPDGSEWGMSRSYRPDGQLLKTTVTGGTKSEDNSETNYSYDEAGRLLEVKSGNTIHNRYEYDVKSGKSVTELFDSRPLDPNTAYGGSWEGTELGFPPTAGGSVTTSYNEHGVATGAKFFDAKGNLVGHITRRFDSDDRVAEEEQAADALPVSLPEEMKSHFNPEQLRSVGALIAGAQSSTISYSYDAQGRMIERHRSGGAFGKQITITQYNDQGDKSSERMTMVMNPDTGPWTLTEAGAFLPQGPANPPQPPITSETQYTYQYDRYGNWTEQTIAGRSQPDQPFQPGTVIRRELTYY